MYKVHKTRFAGLGFWNPCKGQWRVCDQHDPQPKDAVPRSVGPIYGSRAALINDLERYAVESWNYAPLTPDAKTEEAKAFGGLNAREQLKATEYWLGFQDEDLSAGLKSPEDALKLYRGWLNDDALPEMADVDYEIPGDMAKARIKILGYDPLA